MIIDKKVFLGIIFYQQFKNNSYFCTSILTRKETKKYS